MVKFLVRIQRGTDSNFVHEITSSKRPLM
jgi:hypothetical protein